MTLGVDRPRPGDVSLPLEVKMVRLAKGRRKRSVAMARLSSSSSMAKSFSIRGHETMTYLCACHLGF
jgi:hypothetical protein